MRDSIGADAGRVLPLLETRSFTFLIEDPATVWNLGPERYTAIADRYRALTPHKEKLGDRPEYRGPVPKRLSTKQQTGTELFQWCTAQRVVSRGWRCILRIRCCRRI